MAPCGASPTVACLYSPYSFSRKATDGLSSSFAAAAASSKVCGGAAFVDKDVARAPSCFCSINRRGQRYSAVACAKRRRFMLRLYCALLLLGETFFVPFVCLRRPPARSLARRTSQGRRPPTRSPQGEEPRTPALSREHRICIPRSSADGRTQRPVARRASATRHSAYARRRIRGGHRVAPGEAHLGSRRDWREARHAAAVHLLRHAVLRGSHKPERCACGNAS